MKPVQLFAIILLCIAATVCFGAGNLLPVTSLNAAEIPTQTTSNSATSNFSTVPTVTESAVANSTVTNSTVINATFETPTQIGDQPSSTSPVHQSETMVKLPIVGPGSSGSTESRVIKLKSADHLLEVLDNASGVILVDFYADWCAPCNRQCDILRNMEQSAAQNNAIILKINVDQYQRLTKLFKVTNLPTMLVIKNGKIIERKTGVADHQQVATLLAK